MPDKQTLERARRDRRQGKAPSTQTGEFIREEMHHIREGKHGARSTRQATAIGLSKARRAGVRLKPPARGKTSASVRRKSRRDYQRGARAKHPSPTRSRAVRGALRRQGRGAASHAALSRQARSAARRRIATERSAVARRAAMARSRRQHARSR